MVVVSELTWGTAASFKARISASSVCVATLIWKEEDFMLLFVDRGNWQLSRLF